MYEFERRMQRLEVEMLHPSFIIIISALERPPPCQMSDNQSYCPDAIY